MEWYIEKKLDVYDKNKLKKLELVKIGQWNIKWKNINLNKKKGGKNMEKKKINWIGMLIEIIKVAIGFIAGTQV